ncbi:MAG TPA: hypothetical protein VMT79_00970 [Candidatus Binatia bacterium]|nr:hypothetical protein [Candidatus Binatia bacterium]
MSPVPAISRRILARTAGSLSRSSIASMPPSSIQSGKSVRTVVLDAV